MRRINRDPERFEVIHLFEAMARKRGLKLNDPSSHQSFLDRVSDGFNSSKNNPIIIHGRRIESMFEHVAAGLGKTILIKREDAGDVCSADPDVQPPDFRLVLDGGTDLFVEVKNCHKADPNYRFSLKRSYLSALEKYAAIFGRDLYLAIFWSRWGKWTLISPVQLTPVERPSIKFLDAVTKNEMSLLGDVLVGTTPPLSLRIITNPSKPRTVNADGECTFYISSAELYCDGVRIEDPLEQNLAFYFLLNSDWEVGNAKAKLEGDQLIYFDSVAEPREPVPNQGFQILGFLSEIISRNYNDITAESGKVHQLSPGNEPGSLGIVIPQEYKGKSLPLWRFTVVAK
ncbi:MAG: hypothetical protein A2W66_00530 [Deltaproteobacteria bacterium RIFCSPLOWO2_02_56_12]|nr:MAG: hypothetical protein A2W66_00530 [Deltaproteobacteria bacterium RIFCSPLOWO2_02_56_12]